VSRLYIVQCVVAIMELFVISCNHNDYKYNNYNNSDHLCVHFSCVGYVG